MAGERGGDLTLPGCRFGIVLDTRQSGSAFKSVKKKKLSHKIQLNERDCEACFYLCGEFYSGER